MRSIAYRIMEFVVKRSGIKKLCQLNGAELYNYLNKHCSNQKHTPPQYIYRKHIVEQEVFSGNLCYVISAKSTRSEKTILFIHGGAYCLEISTLHWKVISKLIIETEATIYVPIYPLTPQYTYRESIEMMVSVYKTMLANFNPKTIFILGDSAGAQIGLSLCQYLKAIGLPQPRDIILVSPLVELAPKGEMHENMKKIDRFDCMLSVQLFETVTRYWARGTSMDNYLVSPIYGDFTGLAKISIFSGTYDVLNAQMTHLIEAARGAGVIVDYYERENMMHTWVYLPISKESKRAFNQIVKILCTNEYISN